MTSEATVQVWCGEGMGSLKAFYLDTRMLKAGWYESGVVYDLDDDIPFRNVEDPRFMRFEAWRRPHASPC